MTSFTQTWNNITQNILASKRVSPSAIAIPIDNVDCRDDMHQPFEANNDYFQVTINQLYLQYQRNWLTNIDPLVIVVSDFFYDKKMQELPFIVGPGQVKQLAQKEPKGMLFRNEKVAGLHPYRGGNITLSVVLCQVPVSSPAQSFLGVLEKATKMLDIATTVNTYITIGKVILDGIDSILGLNGTLPLIGMRTTFSAQGGNPLKPYYFALIDAPDVKPESLKVENNQLIDVNTGKPYQNADFVLYSILRAPKRRRDDHEQLPYYELWERTVLEATSLKEGSWDNAKANFIALMNNLYLSPDLTRPQSLELIEKYKADLTAYHKNAIGISTLSDKQIKQIDALDEIRLMTSSIMKI